MKELLKNKRFQFTFMLTLVSAAAIYAQFNSAAAENIKSEVENIGKTVYTVIYSIAAIAGVVGGISVAWAYWNSKENAPDQLKKWGIGFIIILLLGFIIHMFTGVNFTS